MDWLEIFYKIINVLAVLGIFSIIWNIFLYRDNKKLKRLDLEKNLKKKEIEFKVLLDKHSQEHAEAMNSIEGEVGWINPHLHVNFLTPGDKEKLSTLNKKQYSEMESLLVDIDYLRKMLGDYDSLGFKKQSMLKKIKQKFKIK